jgi:hypothetical protein
MELVQRFDIHNPVHAGAVAVAAVAVTSLAVWITRRRRVPPIEAERRRRLWLVRHGRLIDGTVLDLTEIPAEKPADGTGQYLLYQYEIAGVAYESSQEVTHLGGYVDIQNCRIDLPASIKYDPHNPANSIVVAENWSGLHEGRSGMRLA